MSKILVSIILLVDSVAEMTQDESCHLVDYIEKLDKNEQNKIK